MSYPSVSQFMPANPTQDEAKQAIWHAIQIDLSVGVEWLKENFGSSMKSGQTVSIENDPSSRLGKQLIRLIGCDSTRTILEEQFGVRFTFYNCCGVVGTKGKDKPKIDYIKQAQAQVAPDC